MFHFLLWCFILEGSGAVSGGVASDDVSVEAQFEKRPAADDSAGAAHCAKDTRRQEEEKEHVVIDSKRQEVGKSSAVAAAVAQRDEENKLKMAEARRREEERIKAAAEARRREEERVKAAAEGRWREEEEKVKAAAEARRREEERVKAATEARRREEEERMQTAVASSSDEDVDIDALLGALTDGSSDDEEIVARQAATVAPPGKGQPGEGGFTQKQVGVADKDTGFRLLDFSVHLLQNVVADPLWEGLETPEGMQVPLYSEIEGEFLLLFIVVSWFQGELAENEVCAGFGS